MIDLLRTALVLLTLVFSTSAVAGHHGDHERTQAPNIVETAAAAGQFETLIAAAKAAGLVGALTGDDQLTVFAPTDDAFGALPAGTIASLLEPENRDQLAAILKYHVIAGRVGSGALADGATLETLAGPSATIQAAEQGFTIEGARIVATDIDASNGIVHVIDRVIMPPKRMIKRDALMEINRAISRGVPMFNHGEPERTVAIYDATATRLLNEGPELDSHDRSALANGIAESRAMDDSNASAWRLRYALDELSRSLQANR